MRWRTRRGFAVVSMAGLLVVLVVALGYGQSTAPSSRELKRLVRMSPVPPDPGEGSPTAAGQARVGNAPTEEAETVTNVQVSKRQRPGDSLRVGASETTLASTPDGQKLVAGWNDGEGFAFAPFGPPPALGLSGFGVSTNGGASWTDAGAPPPGSVVALGPGRRGQSATGRYVTRGDPWLAAAGTGKGETTLYFSNLAVWEDQDPAGPPAGVSVHRGRFSGKGFAWTDAVLLQSPNYPDDFLDKEAMTADGSAVYVTVTNFIELCRQPFFGFGQIELYRSLDGGTTWSRRIVQPDEAFVTDPKDPTCGQDGIVNQGSAPAVGPSGELYIVWERGWFAPLLGGGTQWAAAGHHRLPPLAGPGAELRVAADAGLPLLRGAQPAGRLQPHRHQRLPAHRRHPDGQARRADPRHLPGLPGRRRDGTLRAGHRRLRDLLRRPGGALERPHPAAPAGRPAHPVLAGGGGRRAGRGHGRLLSEPRGERDEGPQRPGVLGASGRSAGQPDPAPEPGELAGGRLPGALARRGADLELPGPRDHPDHQLVPGHTAQQHHPQLR